MKVILLIHRYLAVAIGLLMVLWCLSGFVMMYQSMPALSAEQRLNGLAPLDLGQCCDVAGLALADEAPAPAFRIEMLLGDPVFRPGGGGRLAQALKATNLRTGQPIAELSEAQVLQVAEQFRSGNDLDGKARSLGVIDTDQWTLQTARRNAPAWRIALDDSAGTEIYIAGASGEVFQATTRRERFLSWFGAVPHWIYPTILRMNGPLWTQVVIWTSIAGSFLAATGLYVGISRLRRNKQGELASPFRGWWYWHHVSGLLFGILALTWVFSGLMTMNPWGALEGGGGGEYRRLFNSGGSWGDAKRFLAAAATLQESEYRQIQPSSFDGNLYLLAQRADGTVDRFDSNAQPAALSEAEVNAVVARLDAPVREFIQLTEEDTYYYGHKRDASLPVWRVLLDDEEATRLYIDNDTGSVRAVGSTGRLSRWIRSGLHDMDFPGLRIRPVWDIVVILLLAGVTSLCMIGTWLAIKRVRMDLRLFRARRLRRR